MSREQLLATTFVELANTLEDDFEELDFLQNLVERSTEILHASAAWLMLADHRRELRLVASSTHTARAVDLIALSDAEGPCREAFRTGKPVLNVVAGEAFARWPQFTAATEGLGFGSAQVLPLRFHSQVLGTLNLLFDEATTFSADDEAVGLALVEVATIGLLQERTPRQREILAERLQGALDVRVVIEQAKGVVAERASLDVDRAFDLIVRYARRRGLPISAVATDVIEGTLTVEALDEA